MGRLLFALALGLGAATMGLVAAGSYRADQAWREMLALGDELQGAIDGADARRPVLLGEGTTGNAHDDYARALARLSPTADADWRACRDALEEGSEEGGALRDALLDEHEGMLRALARGAHRTTARYRLRWERGFEATLPRLLDRRTVVHLAVLAAERHLDEGRPDRAVEVLLDAMQFGRDHVLGPVLISSMVGCALLDMAGKQALIDGGLLERIPRSELGRLVGGMRRLDEGLSMPNRAHAGEIVLFVRHAERAVSLGSAFAFVPSGVSSSWRYGFSARRLLAAYARESADRLRVLRETEWAPWPERERTLRTLRRGIEDSPHPITRRLAPVLLSAEESLYTARAGFRITRAAAEYRLEGRAPRIEDPFGGDLVITETGGTLRISSAGPGRDRRSDLHTIELERH